MSITFVVHMLVVPVMLAVSDALSSRGAEVTFFSYHIVPFKVIFYLLYLLLCKNSTMNLQNQCSD